MLSRVLTRSGAAVPRRFLFQYGPRSRVDGRLSGLTPSTHISQLRNASASRPFRNTKTKGPDPRSPKSDSSLPPPELSLNWFWREFGDAARFAVRFWAVAWIIMFAEWYFDLSAYELIMFNHPLISNHPLPTKPKLSRVRFADERRMKRAAKEIEDTLGPQAVSYDQDEIERHGHSDWSTSNSKGRPVAIVYPRNTQEVSEIAKICNEHQCPIVPFGAGSSVEGSFSSPYSGICVDFVHMDRIVAFHPDDMDVVVQPGVNWVDLNKSIEESGLFLPLDPSPTAMIGGMVSTNCSGTNAFRYGTMKDWVLNLTVVLADGRVIKTRKRPRKNSAGYNLTSLFVGAEGTLGLVTEITLKLAVVPEDTSVAVVSFPSIGEAARAATKLIRSGIQLGALEFMDEVQMQVINRHGSEAVRKTAWDESPTLFLKFAGTTEGIKADVAKVKRIVDPFKPGKIFFARDKQQEADLWAARKEALWTMTSIKPDGYAMWSTDVAVPISRLAEIIADSKEDSGDLGLFASVIGHVGDGNFHQAVMYDPKNPEHKEGVSRCVHKMMNRALEMEGTISGEHAIGIGKKDCLVDELGLDTIGLMKLIKQSFDPAWIMNPGKVFDLPPKSTAKAVDVDVE